MRNLKKILALVLALVMSLSLMATAGAADAAATSSETVTPAYEIALQVLGKDGLKVFGGYTDGTIRPQNNITRAEVAAILYRIVTGDVTDAQAGIYTDMANVNFNDLTGANWAKGYINYCANAQLIVGVGGNQFKPLANITGYATLAMILRALGYDKNGEFKGSGWEIRTASKARELGILKNVSENQLGAAATRELVAELLFRAMLCSKVTYNALTQDYDETGVTLAYESFKLEEVEGVVVANEYADIRDGGTAPTAADRTVINDGENDRIVTIGSTLEDLGETRRVYTIKTGTRDTYDECLGLEDIEADTIQETGDALTEREVNSMIGRTDASTKQLINYGQNLGNVTTAIKVSYLAERIVDNTIVARSQDDAESVFRTRYNLSGTAALVTTQRVYNGSSSWSISYTPAAPTDIPTATRTVAGHTYSVIPYTGGAFVYKVEIAPNSVYTDDDQRVIRTIFNTADLDPSSGADLIINGEVYRGTQSVTDYSDWRSYEQFVEDCLNEAELINSVGANELGWTLKIIDNDKDGVTDWVLQTRYTVASVARMNDTTPVLETEAAWRAHSYDDNVNLSASPAAVIPGEDVAAGDVVLYAMIDGTARVWKAKTADVRVDSINRNTLTITTADGTNYTESGVHEHSARTDIDSGVLNMAGKTAYILYLDRYDNLAAFSQNITGKFTLLTDGWYHTLKNGAEYAVQTWDQETQAFVQYDVTSGGNLFINRFSNDANGWNRIAHFSALNCDDVSHTATSDDLHTMIAYMETDGETATLLPVDMVYDTQRIEGMRPIKMIDMGKTIPNHISTANVGTIYETTVASAANNGTYASRVAGTVEVRALDNTVYYYVYRSWHNNTPTTVVRQFTGYANGANWLTTAQQRACIEDVYAVGTRSWHVDANGDTTANETYYTATAVVVELDDNFYNIFHEDHEEVFIYDFESVISNVNYERVKAINEKGEDVEFTIDLTQSRRVYAEGSDKFGTTFTGNVPAPGLFYLHRTENADIWAVERMSHADIRLSGHYDVGTVGYSGFTVGNNYANIWNWYTNNPGFHWDAVANGGCGIGVDHANPRPGTMSSDTNLGANRYNSESSVYYRLSYAEGRTDYIPTLTKLENDAAEGLRENVPGDSINGTANQVLVRYASNGNVVYAISFAHGTTNSENFAQQVYRGVLMDTAPLGSRRLLEISLEEAATLALADGVKLTDAIDGITVDWAGNTGGAVAMTKDAANDKFTTRVDRVATYTITIDWAEEYAKGGLTSGDVERVTVTGDGTVFTLTFLDGSAASVRLQIPADSIEEAETRTADEARADAKAELAKPVDTSKLNETGVKMVDDAKKALQAVIDNEDATVAELDAAVVTYKTAIEEALKEIADDGGLAAAIAAANEAMKRPTEEQYNALSDAKKTLVDDAKTALEEAIASEVVDDIIAATTEYTKAVGEALTPDEGAVTITFVRDDTRPGSLKQIGDTELKMPAPDTTAKVGDSFTAPALTEYKDLALDENHRLKLIVYIVVDGEDTALCMDAYADGAVIRPFTVTGDTTVYYCFSAVPTTGGNTGGDGGDEGEGGGNEDANRPDGGTNEGGGIVPPNGGGEVVSRANLQTLAIDWDNEVQAVTFRAWYLAPKNAITVNASVGTPAKPVNGVPAVPADMQSWAEENNLLTDNDWWYVQFTAEDGVFNRPTWETVLPESMTEEEAVEAIDEYAKSVLEDTTLNLEGGQEAAIKAAQEDAKNYLIDAKDGADRKAIVDEFKAKVSEIVATNTTTPDINTEERTISLNYTLEKGETRLSGTALKSKLDDNKEGLTFTVPASFDNGDATPGTVIVTDQNEEHYIVTLTQMFKVTLGTKVLGYVAEAETTISDTDVDDGDYILASDDVVAAKVASAASGTLTFDAAPTANVELAKAVKVTFTDTKFTYNASHSRITVGNKEVKSNDFVKADATLTIKDVEITGADATPYNVITVNDEQVGNALYVADGETGTLRTVTADVELPEGGSAMSIALEKGFRIDFNGRPLGVYATLTEILKSSGVTAGDYVPVAIQTADGVTTGTAWAATNALVVSTHGTPADQATKWAVNANSLIDGDYAVKGVINFVPAVKVTIPDSGFDDMKLKGSYGTMTEPANLAESDAAISGNEVYYVAKGTTLVLEDKLVENTAVIGATDKVYATWPVTETTNGSQELTKTAEIPAANGEPAKPATYTVPADVLNETIQADGAFSFEVREQAATSIELAVGADFKTGSDPAFGVAEPTVTGADVAIRYSYTDSYGLVASGGSKPADIDAIQADDDGNKNVDVTVIVQAADGYYFAGQPTVTGLNEYPDAVITWNAETGTLTITLTIVAKDTTI